MKFSQHFSIRMIVASILVGLVALVLLLSQNRVAAITPQGVSEDGLWYEVAENEITQQGERLIFPKKYRLLAVDLAGLQNNLDGSAVVWLPLPDGSFGRFQISATDLMHPDLAAKFPEIRTYAGVGLDDPSATARLDVTPAGFHGMILSAGDTVYIDPYSRQDTSHYLSYYRQDALNLHMGYRQYEPLGDPAEIEALAEEIQAGGFGIPSGDQLRTYRLAVAATGEYTIFHGGTVPNGMAAIVTAVNRVVGIYIRDTAVNMQLVANNDLIVYTNPATDPYTNNNGSAMLGQNQTNLDAVIGNANYDVGHVFSTGGGGVASLGVPCRTGLKARGVTGLPSPVGDPFYVDYVAHEMGHQFGANHTFNGNAGSCAGGNRHGPTAYEPGSGSTIMAYAGICGAQNLQPNSDDHFHTGSIDEIRTYTVLGLGNGCAAITNTPNLPPVVDAGANYTIPINTPFTLIGAATDPNGDALDYNWEQFDTGPAGAPGSPTGNAPLFRSFSSVGTPERTFPKISDIVNNTQTIGEILPSYGRNMKFHLTVRDNYVGAGGVAKDETIITVSAGAGPFLVTYPNTAVTWTGGESRTITWNVANTNLAPVSCAEVDIHLSLDGGYTYPVLVEANRPNDGSEEVIVPNNATTQARIRVKCSNNVFFDISNVNFTILAATLPVLNVSKEVSGPTEPQPGDELEYTIEVNNTGVAGTAVITDVFDLALTNTSCNSVPGDLYDTVALNSGESAVYTCTANIDSTLAVAISKAVDQAEVVVGTAVTYTIAITNPHATLTLNPVTVADPLVAGCVPALGNPISLAPGASQIYTCANNIITENVTNTATVTAVYEILNVAQASAVGSDEVVSSDVVSTAVVVSASDSVVVVATLPTDLQLTKAVSGPAEPQPGDELEYTIEVNNTGAALTAVITDVFDVALTNTSCNSVPGDLYDTVVLNSGESAVYTCTADIDATLAVEISKVVDQAVVAAGTAVTYTISITNPNSAITLTQVTIDDPQVSGCLPVVPITLAPGEVQTYVCADNIITESVTNTATVTAVYEILNVAQASVVAEDVLVSSNVVNTAVGLSASASASVEVIPAPNFIIYLPFISNGISEETD